MKNKVLFILTAYMFVFLLGLNSCEKCGPFPENFKVAGFDFDNVSATFSETDEPKLAFSEISNDTILYNLFSVLIETKAEAIVHVDPTFNLINAAVACSPTIPRTDEKIDSILITTNQDFDETHQSGTNLHALFDIVVFDEANNIFNEKYTLINYIETKPFIPNNMFLILNSPPETSMHVEFTIHLFLDGIDIDFFEIKTKKVFIKIE